MNFFEKTFLDWKVTLDPIAAKKPPQLKVASLAEASATPPTIGSSEPTTASVGASPRNSAESSTEKKGSIALMVWVKDTATAPSETLVSRFPSVCTAARGSTALISVLVDFRARVQLEEPHRARERAADGKLQRRARQREREDFEDLLVVDVEPDVEGVPSSKKAAE